MKLEYTVKHFCYECGSFEQLHYEAKAQFLTGEMAYASALLNVKHLMQELYSENRDSNEVLSKLYKQIDESYEKMINTMTTRIIR